MHRERCAGLGTSRNTGKNKGDEDEYGKIAHEDRFGWQHNRFVLMLRQTRFQDMYLSSQKNAPGSEIARHWKNAWNKV